MTFPPVLELLRSTVPLAASQYINLPLPEVFMGGLSADKFIHFGLPESFGLPLQVALKIDLSGNGDNDPVPVTAMYDGEIQFIYAGTPVSGPDRHGRPTAFAETHGILLQVSTKPEVTEKIELLLNDNPATIGTPVPRFVFYEGLSTPPGTALTEVITINGFEEALSNLPPKSATLIQKAAQVWEPGLLISVIGHTDTRDFVPGSEIDNQQLGLNRVESVVAALRTEIENLHGPNNPGDNINVFVSPVSRGESDPAIFPELTDKDREKNRRVEIIIRRDRVEVSAGDIIGEANGPISVFALNNESLYLDPLAIPLRVFPDYQSFPFAQNRDENAPRITSRYIRYIANDVSSNPIVFHHPTLSDALISARDGDVVCLSQDADVADANGNFPLGGELNVGFPIALIGHNFQAVGSPPRLFADHDRRFLQIAPNEALNPNFEDVPVHINGITFSGGRDVFGGGALIASDIDMILISNCRFENCEQFDVNADDPVLATLGHISLGWGGAIQIVGRQQDGRAVTNAVFHQTAFQNNRSFAGGAIAIATCDQVLFNECIFHQNRAAFPDGQAWNSVGPPVATPFENDVEMFFRFNRLLDRFPDSILEFGGNGAAAFIASCQETSIKNCSFTSNQDAACGGALYLLDSNQVQIVGNPVSQITDVIGIGSNNVNDNWSASIPTDSPVLDPASFSSRLNNHNTAREAGGAIFAKNSVVLIENTLIQNNQTVDGATRGGGMALTLDQEFAPTENETTDTPSIVISGSVIANNQSGFGAGISIVRGDENEASLTGQELNNADTLAAPFRVIKIDSSIIHDNQASRIGGGVHCLANTLDAENCRFSKNQAQQNGGAIAVLGGGAANLIKNRLIENSVIPVNSAETAGGGGIFVLGGMYKTVLLPNVPEEYNRPTEIILKENLFVRNKTSGSGGAILCTQNAHVDVVSSNLFHSNLAGQDGGAIFSENAALRIKQSNWFIQNRTANVGNAAGRDGGAICVSGTLISPESIKWGRGVVYANYPDVLDGVRLVGATLIIRGHAPVSEITTIPQTLGNDHVFFIQNQATGQGGAIHIRQRNIPPPPHISNNRYEFGQWRGLCLVENIEINQAVFADNTAGNQIAGGVSMQGNPVPTVQGAAIAVENINFDWVEVVFSTDINPVFRFQNLSFLHQVGAPMHFSRSQLQANRVFESGFFVTTTDSQAVYDVIFTPEGP